MVWSVGSALIRRVRHLLAERSHERGGHGALPFVSNLLGMPDWPSVTLVGKPRSSTGMENQGRHGILMRGIGRWIVYSWPRAWLGMNVEIPSLLRGIDLPRGAVCLDIAAGLGWASAGIARRHPSAQIVSLDYDETILPRAREYLSAHGAAANPALCQADAKRLPFRSGAFDLVVCLYGLHHVCGYSEGLREVARVLKPTGGFALIDPIRKSGKPPGGHHGTEVLTQEELDRMLREAGFETVMFRESLGRVKVVARKAKSVTLAA
jgi:SAM-dependent methyltransferase